MASIYQLAGAPEARPRARLGRLIAGVKPPPFKFAVDRSKRFLAPSQPHQALRRLEREWIDWIHSKANWSVMVTLTFRRLTSRGLNVTPTAVEHALKRVVRLINCDFFGKRRTNKGWTIAHAVTSDSGRYGDHPHAHLLLAVPEGATEEELCAVVERAVQRTRLVSRQRHYAQYFSVGGAEYVVKHGTDRMVVSLISPAYPAK